VGWLRELFGGGRRRRDEARRASEAEVQRLLEELGPRDAWRALEVRLAQDEDPIGLFAVAARVLRLGGEAETAELFDRAADAPHELERLLELGSALLTREQADAASAVLGRALELAPFDAVVRSELALAQAQAGRPDRVVETLALHPCLAEDPGVLFQFAWASMLLGDLDAADGACGQLRGAPSLRGTLEDAIARARLTDGRGPDDARQFYFVEYGGILVDTDGPLRGRYDALTLDRARVRSLVARTGAVLRELVPAPRRVLALEECARPLALALAEACGGLVVPPPGARPSTDQRVAAGTLAVVARGEQFESSAVREYGALAVRGPDRGGLTLVALSMDSARSCAFAPDVVGVFARDVGFADDAFDASGELPRGEDPERAMPPSSAIAGAAGAHSRDGVVGSSVLDGALAAFLETRRAWLPPRRRGRRRAYVPDAPLPR
jgi:hypothetical protein